MKSIMQSENRCYVCGGERDLEEHHIFGGCRRKQSEKYGLKVKLCKIHHTGSQGVHFNSRLMSRLHQDGQKTFQKAFTNLDFMQVFGKNYL
jgi:hypothetical protein